MRAKAVRRMPVVENGRLVGIVTLGDVAREEDPQSALAEVSAATPNRLTEVRALHVKPRPI
jgi:CBS domain-containing protein